MPPSISHLDDPIYSYSKLDNSPKITLDFPSTLIDVIQTYRIQKLSTKDPEDPDNVIWEVRFYDKDGNLVADAELYVDEKYGEHDEFWKEVVVGNGGRRKVGLKCFFIETGLYCCEYPSEEYEEC